MSCVVKGPRPFGAVHLGIFLAGVAAAEVLAAQGSGLPPVLAATASMANAAQAPSSFADVIAMVEPSACRCW
jgi:hypothetical protein